MAGQWLSLGANEASQLLFQYIGGVSWVAGLYVNNHTPSWTDTSGNYTECTAPGYTEQAFNANFWNQTSTGASPWTNTYAPMIFSFTGSGSQTLFGYFVKNVVTGNIWWAEKFTTAYALPTGASNYVLVPSFTFGQCGAC